MNKVLNTDFFDRPSPIVAKDLLGKIIKYKDISGRIVETEAYEGFDDEAAHSYVGKTQRNRAVFLGPGHIYLHKIHTHICIDLVCKKVNGPNSVLLRALEPIDGIDKMQKNRNKQRLIDLCSGPGKLTQALGIGFKLNGLKFTRQESPLKLLDDQYEVDKIIKAKRVGISKEKELENRFYIENNKHISKK